MADPARIDVDRLAQEIRAIDGPHTMESDRLAKYLVQGESIQGLVCEVERARASEINFYKHGMYLTTTLREITDLVNSESDSDLAIKIRSMVADMWQDISDKSPGHAQSLWNKLTRSEQEEYRDIHYEPGQPGGEERSREIEQLAHSRLAAESVDEL